MANQQGNGRNAMSDEARQSWRPQDDNATQRSRRGISDDDDRSYGFGRDRDFGGRDEDRFMSRDRERMGSQWDDRSGRWDDREDRSRSTEYYGQGQSGYGAGRYEGDRSYGSRNQTQMSDWRDRGLDEHGNISGYGNQGYGQSGQYGHGYGSQGMGGQYGSQGYGGYGQQREQGYQSGGGSGQMNRVGGYLGQGGQQLGYGNRMHEQQGQQMGGRGVQNQGGLYGQGGYNEGMYGQGGMQNRYGSQGYQGVGQQGYGSQGIGAVGQQGWNQQSMGQLHRGKGPAGFTRSDDRIKEIVCEVLTDNDQVDATNVDITVKNGEVTLSGTVEDRQQKRIAEDLVENLSFVKDVTNQLRVGSADKKSQSSRETETSASSSDKRHRA